MNKVGIHHDQPSARTRNTAPSTNGAINIAQAPCWFGTQPADFGGRRTEVRGGLLAWVAGMAEF